MKKFVKRERERRLFSLLFVLSLLLCLVPTAAFAADDDTNIDENPKDSTLDSNYGTITYNYGRITENHGTVEVNDGSAFDGYIHDNYGLVKENNGTVVYNYGTVNINNDHVLENYGMILDNREAVLFNFGHVVCTEAGFVECNAGGTIEGGTAMYEYYPLDVSYDNLMGVGCDDTNAPTLYLFMDSNNRLWMWENGIAIIQASGGYEPVIISGSGTITPAGGNLYHLSGITGPVTLDAQPKSDNAYSVPATADNSNMPLWGGLLILFAATAVLTGKKRRS